MVILGCHILLDYIATTQQYCWHVPTDQELLGALWATDLAMLKKNIHFSHGQVGIKLERIPVGFILMTYRQEVRTFRLKISGDIMPQVKKDSGIHRFFWG